MTTETTPVDLQESNGQIQSKAYIYKLKHSDQQHFYATVIATNSTSARSGLSQQFSNHSVSFLGICDHIMQVNG